MTVPPMSPRRNFGRSDIFSEPYVQFVGKRHPVFDWRADVAAPECNAEMVSSVNREGYLDSMTMVSRFHTVTTGRQQNVLLAPMALTGGDRGDGKPSPTACAHRALFWRALMGALSEIPSAEWSSQSWATVPVESMCAWAQRYCATADEPAGTGQQQQPKDPPVSAAAPEGKKKIVRARRGPRVPVAAWDVDVQTWDGVQIQTVIEPSLRIFDRAATAKSRLARALGAEPRKVIRDIVALWTRTAAIAESGERILIDDSHPMFPAMGAGFVLFASDEAAVTIAAVGSPSVAAAAGSLSVVGALGMLAAHMANSAPAWFGAPPSPRETLLAADPKHPPSETAAAPPMPDHVSAECARIVTGENQDADDRSVRGHVQRGRRGAIFWGCTKEEFSGLASGIVEVCEASRRAACVVTRRPAWWAEAFENKWPKGSREQRVVAAYRFRDAEAHRTAHGLPRFEVVVVDSSDPSTISSNLGDPRADAQPEGLLPFRIVCMGNCSFPIAVTTALWAVLNNNMAFRFNEVVPGSESVPPPKSSNTTLPTGSEPRVPSLASNTEKTRPRAGNERSAEQYLRWLVWCKTIIVSSEADAATVPREATAAPEAVPVKGHARAVVGVVREWLLCAPPNGAAGASDDGKELRRVLVVIPKFRHDISDDASPAFTTASVARRVRQALTENLAGSVLDMNSVPVGTTQRAWSELLSVADRHASAQNNKSIPRVVVACAETVGSLAGVASLGRNWCLVEARPSAVRWTSMHMDGLGRTCGRHVKLYESESPEDPRFSRSDETMFDRAVRRAAHGRESDAGGSSSINTARFLNGWPVLSFPERLKPDASFGHLVRCEREWRARFPDGGGGKK